MKKLLGILVLGLLLSGNAYADNYKILNPNKYCSKIALPTDVASKDKLDALIEKAK